MTNKTMRILRGSCIGGLLSLRGLVRLFKLICACLEPSKPERHNQNSTSDHGKGELNAEREAYVMPVDRCFALEVSFFDWRRHTDAGQLVSVRPHIAIYPSSCAILVIRETLFQLGLI